VYYCSIDLREIVIMSKLLTLINEILELHALGHDIDNIAIRVGVNNSIVSSIINNDNTFEYETNDYCVEPINDTLDFDYTDYIINEDNDYGIYLTLNNLGIYNRVNNRNYDY